MTLSEWQKKHGIKTRDLASQLGITPSGVHRILQGNRYPSPALARKIIVLSDGEIDWEGLYGPVENNGTDG
jgi:transcriptional regulator with XRE-family HTH domain